MPPLLFQPGGVRVADEVVHAVQIQDLIHAMLGDEFRQVVPVIAQVHQIDALVVGRQEGAEAVGVGVPDDQDAPLLRAGVGDVHQAVVAAGEKESGITIHYINEHYDEGDTIFRATCPVLPTDSPGDVAEKVHALEYEHFPRVIEQIITTL